MTNLEKLKQMIPDHVRAQILRPESALQTQVAGTHYQNRAIQPVEYIHANGLGFLEGCIIKRITRWRDKDGFADLEKIKHEVDLLIELETRKAARA